MRGITLFNYGGSGTIGLMNAGFQVPAILEIDQDMIENGAAQHFMHNYPSIPVLAPETWNTEEYLNSLKEQDLDIIIVWPPCSGLSMINRHASADNVINHYIYDWANTVKKIHPKTFVMENAPTLLTKGKRIVDDILEKLNEDYRFTIIRDIVTHICKNYDKYEDRLTEAQKKRLANTLTKIREDKSYFDKSPNKLKANGYSPSLTSVTELIHYSENRPLFIREYAAIMGYSDNYEFLENVRVPYLQSIAQGVPAKFLEWIATEVKTKLENIEDYKGLIPPEYDIVYEHLASGKTEMAYYTLESFKETEKIAGGIKNERVC